jgi:hypothetical protein
LYSGWLLSQEFLNEEALEKLATSNKDLSGPLTFEPLFVGLTASTSSGASPASAKSSSLKEASKLSFLFGCYSTVKNKSKLSD